MIDLLLGGIILLLVTGFSYHVHEMSLERTKLINALLAKNSQEYVSRTLAENTKITPEVTTPPADPDLVPFDQVNEDQFDAHIQATLGNEIVDQEVT